ncbi:MAG TPA: hypothetical protein DIU37_00250 [Opitutae bacterium]|nr:hypothetical protein [Opitutae bacterium]
MRQSVCIKSWVFCGLVLLGACVSVFGEDKIEAMKQCAAKSEWIRKFCTKDYGVDPLIAVFHECWKGESDTLENIYSECRRVYENHALMNVSEACPLVRDVIREYADLSVYDEDQVTAAFEACLEGDWDPLWDVYHECMKEMFAAIVLMEPHNRVPDWLRVYIDALTYFVFGVDAFTVKECFEDIFDGNISSQKIAIVAMRLIATQSAFVYYNSMHYGYLQRGLNFADIL